MSIAAKLVADLLMAAGVNRVITMDLHADQIQGFFRRSRRPTSMHRRCSSPTSRASSSPTWWWPLPTWAAPGVPTPYAKYLDVPLVLCHKQRAKANVVEAMTVIGDVKDKNVILIDDMVDTAGTICKAANLMMEKGAKSVRALASHAIMSDPASQRASTTADDRDDIHQLHPVLQRFAARPQSSAWPRCFADTIKRVHNNESISSRYVFK